MNECDNLGNTSRACKTSNLNIFQATKLNETLIDQYWWKPIGKHALQSKHLPISTVNKMFYFIQNYQVELFLNISTKMQR